MIGIFKKNNILFAIGILIILMHLLRNISFIYVPVVGISLLYFLFSSLHYRRKVIFKNCVFLIIIALIYVSILSIISIQEDSPFLGLFRFFYLSPIILYFFSANIDESKSILFWKIILFFLIASSFSILIQYATGPIYWFAPSSERAGVDRFASLAGSLTIFGSAVGLGLIISNLIYKKGILFFGSVIILLVGAVLSLQKMAIASVTISIILVFFIKNKNLSKKTIYKLTSSFFIMAIITIAVYGFIYKNFPEHIRYFSLILTADSTATGDINVTTSMHDRFFALPLQVVKHWGILSIISGLGVYGGAGGLGYRELPMAHNLIFETIFIFGLPIGILITALILNYLIRSFKIVFKSTNPRVTIAAAVFITLFITNVFSGGLFYHPVIGLAFWFSVSEIYKNSRHV